MVMTPEGGMPTQMGGEEKVSGTKSVAEGIMSLQAGVQTLFDSLQKSGAPEQAVALAKAAADAMTQLTQMMTGGGQSAQEVQS